MYEDLEIIARLRYVKEMESISATTRERVQEAQSRYAALTGAGGIRSGQHEASIARIWIEGSEQMARSLFDIWVRLIERRNGHIGRHDVAFVSGKIEAFTQSQTGHLRKVFQQRPSTIVPMLTEEAGRRMYAASASAKSDLEIRAREDQAFPEKEITKAENEMKETSKRRFSIGRRVLVGNQSRPGVVILVDGQPSVMGEFRHEIKLDDNQEVRAVLGCDLQALPGLDEDLKTVNQSTIHLYVQNSAIANLNLGSQVGTINATLESASGKGDGAEEFAAALKRLTEAVISQESLSNNDKQEMVQALSTIAEQATKKPEDQSKGLVKAILAWIPPVVASTKELASLWEQFGPTIRSYLGI